MTRHYKLSCKLRARRKLRSGHRPVFAGYMGPADAGDLRSIFAGTAARQADPGAALDRRAFQGLLGRAECGSGYVVAFLRPGALGEEEHRENAKKLAACHVNPPTWSQRTV